MICVAWLSHVPSCFLVLVLCKAPEESYIQEGGGMMHMFIQSYVFKLILLIIKSEVKVIAIANI